MIGLLKMFGKGILYVIGFPFFVLALLLFGLVGVFLFIFQLIKSIFYFFTGRKFFPELPEDKELRLMKEKAAGMNNQEEEKEESPVNDTPVQTVNTASEPIITPLPFEKEAQIIQEAPVVQQAPVASQQEEKPKTIEQAIFIDMGDNCPIKPFGSAPEAVQENTPETEVQPQENAFESLLDDEPVLTRNEAPAEEVKPEPIPVEVVPMREETIQTAEPKEAEPQEELEEYVPKGETYYEEVDEEDTGSGVSIDYDL